MIQIQGIGNQTGPKFWRSLNELANTPKFQQWVAREFPEGAADIMNGNSRRNFLQLMAASMGLAGLTSCRRPVEKILPHAKSFEGITHGNSLHFATAMPMAGRAMGLLVESFEGRPVKIEGNPGHPGSRGAANMQAQAAVLSLYDPDRAMDVLEDGKKGSWEGFAKAVGASPDLQGLRVVSSYVNSPTLAGLRAQLLAKSPTAKWVEYEPVSDETILEGSRIAFNDSLRPLYDFKKANVVVALDSDFLQLDNRSLGWVKDFSARRSPAHHEPAAPAAAEHAAPGMNRLYAIESNYSLTGATADHRLRVKPSDVANFVFDLARELGAITGLKVLGQQDKFIKALAKDLNANKGKSIVLAGPRQPAVVHAVVALINQTLANAGETVSYSKEELRSTAALAELVKDINAGAAKSLLILGGNPVYNAPADLGFAGALKKIGNSVYLGPEVNETAAACKCSLPESHFLEAWGDAADSDGTVSIVQPLIEPLFGTKSAAEVVGFLVNGKWQSGYELVKAQWKLADAAWKKALHDGIAAPAPAASKPAGDKTRVEAAVNSAPKAKPGLEVAFFPSANLFDGRFANNAWLQETPEPMTKIVWDNVALMSPKTAKEMDVAETLDNVGMFGKKVAIEIDGRKVEAPVLVMPGHADGAVSLTLGYGRTAIGRVGKGIGYNAYAVRGSSTMGFATGVSVRKIDGTHYLVTTQEHHNQDGRPIVKENTEAGYAKNPHFATHDEEHVELFQLFDSYDYSKGSQWGMAVDLNACIGCNACMVACQSENNVPVVGKDQVAKGRDMHWIRLDRYFTGAEEDPQVVYQPMACQQCENAPCESVCPVAATIHSPEGLNDMAYNRCVGTRYCANNCPYKVRRFNYLNFHKDLEEIQKMVHNPDVSVRMRGVMEKCTYCVQRIQEAKIKAKAEGRARGEAGPYKVGEVLTACQQTCPADAITFGDINDPNSKVAKLKKDHRNYTLLHELNVKPRTTYLAKLRNPNPELA
jgi:molybdopterin-containing oxidoreductase family iron-sulfur binding subunit